MATSNEFENIPETEETEQSFSPVYSFTQKLQRLQSEGKLEYPKYRTLSEEQTRSYLTAKDSPEYQRKSQMLDLKKADENTFWQNAKNAAIIESMDILSGDRTELALGNMLVTEDYEPLVGAGLGVVGAEIGRRAAKEAGKGWFKQTVAGVAGATGVGAIAGIIDPTATVSQSEEMAALTEEQRQGVISALESARISDKDMARQQLKAAGFTDEQIEKLQKPTAIQSVGQALLKDAMDRIEYKAAIAPKVEEGSVAATIVGGALSMGEYLMLGAGGKIVASKIAKSAKMPTDRWGRKAAEFEQKKGTKYEDVVDRYAGMVGTKAGTIAATTNMSAEVMGGGALESIQKYIEDTGDTNLDYYTGDIKNVALDAYNTHIQNVIEQKLGLGKFIKNPRLATKYGEWLNGFAQEFSQGEVNDFVEWVKGDKTIMEVVQNIPQNVIEGIVGGVLQGGIGTATYSYYHGKNVNDLTGVIVAQSTPENPITEKQAREFAEKKVAEIEEGVMSDVAKDIVEFTGATQYQGKIYDTVRDNIKKTIDYQREQMKDTLEGSKYDDMSEDELAQHVESVAQDMTDRIVIEALDKKIPLSEVPQLKGETIEGTYYIEGSDYAKETAEENERNRQMIRDAVYAEKQRQRDDALAEKIADMAEEARKKREAKETAQQTREAEERERLAERTAKQIAQSVAQSLKQQKQVEKVKQDLINVKKKREFGKNPKTVRDLFLRKINLDFARNEGILQAFGFDESSRERFIYFNKNGGLSDWNDILQALQADELIESTSGQPSYDEMVALEDKAKRLLLENPFANLADFTDKFANKDYMQKQEEVKIQDEEARIEEEMNGLLEAKGVDKGEIAKMSWKMKSDKLNELYPQAQEELELNPDEIPDLDFQDLADENESLDAIYPVYDGETIEVDGKERTVYNSNGDRIAKSKEALTNFWNWFGDSKVVDEQGRPLVVYHQTSETFNTFERGRDKAGKYDYETPGGFFFKSSDRNIGIAGNIQMPVYLKAEKTITFDNRQQLQKYWSENIDGYADLLKQYQNVDKDYNARVDNIESDMDKAIDDLENSESYKNATDAQQYQMRSDLMDSFDSTALFDEWRNAANKIAEQMKQLVNDYVSAKNIEMVKLENDSGAIGKKTTDSFIVFEPTQIKSVNNRGTYSADTGNIYYQFAGEKAQTAALEKLAEAKELDAQGWMPEMIRQQTGWFKGADGKWRFEIDDSQATINKDKLSSIGIDFIERILQHDKLYEAYPQLKGMPVFIDTKGILGKNTNAMFTKFPNMDRECIVVSPKIVRNSEELKSTLLHEIQHNIQDIENFARGGSVQEFKTKKLPKNLKDTRFKTELLTTMIYNRVKSKIDVENVTWLLAQKLNDIKKIAANDEALQELVNEFETEYKKVAEYMDSAQQYFKLYGEIEARNVETRAKMTEEERKATPAESTQDIRNADAIVVFNNGTALSYNIPQRQRGKGGAYDARTRSVTLGGGANVTTLPHELAHYWIDKNFKWARSGKASQAWLDQWRAVEKWLGIDPEDKYLDKNASEKFARAYERFLGEEQLPLVLKKSMADFRDFVLDHYDYELDDAKGLQDKLGRPIKLDEGVKAWFRKSVYDSYMSPAESEVVNQRLAQDDRQQAELQPAIEQTEEVQKELSDNPEINQLNVSGKEIQEDAGVSNDVVLGKRTIGGGEEKESKGKIGQALGKTYESTTWEIQENMVDDYLKTVSLDEAIDALDNGTYPDKIDPNFLRNILADKLIEEGRELEAAALIEQTAEDFTQAAQTLQAARRFNTPFTNAIKMLSVSKAMKLAQAKFGKKADAVEQLDAAINALVQKYEADFMAAQTDEERELVYATMQDEAIRTIGTLDKSRTNDLDFQDVDDKEERQQAKAIRIQQKKRASITGYRSRAKRALKQALGIAPTREQVRNIKKLSVKVAKEINEYRRAVKNNTQSAIDPTKILEAQNELNNYMNQEVPAVWYSDLGDAANSFMMANMLWNPATNVFNIESTWVQMLPHLLATTINNRNVGSISWKEKAKLIKQALVLQAKTGYNIFSLRDFFDKKTLWAEKFYEPKTKLGKFQALPLTALGLMDTMNKGIIFLQHADAMATKQATEEGKKNGWNKTQIKERAKELFYQSLNTDPRTITMDGLKIRQSAVIEGEEATFTQNTKTAEIVNKVRKALNLGAKTGVGTLIMPFTTTIANIAEDTVLNYGLGSVRGLRYAPKAIALSFDKKATAEMKKEAWKAVQPETKNVIKNMIGALLLASVAFGDDDDDDYVLGFDRQTEKDKDIRQNRNAPSGYAIRIGNKWIDVDLFGIGSQWMKMYMIANRGGNTTDSIVQAVASNIDMLPGISEVQDMYDKYSQISKWKGDKDAILDLVGGKAEELGVRLIPMSALFNQIGNITDDTKRESWNAWYDAMRAKIPGWREYLPARLSKQTGKEIPQTDVFWNLATGQRVKDYVEPTKDDEARYMLYDLGINMNYREKNSKLKELGVDSERYKKAVREVRSIFSAELPALVDSWSFRNADEEGKRKAVSKLHTQALETVKTKYGLETKKQLKKKK